MDRRRLVGVLAALPFLVLWLAEWVDAVFHWDEASRLLAVDYQLYMDAARRWLDGGPFYLPYQLAGSYLVTPGDVLYPPYSLALFAPFTNLPAILWWAIPVAITTWVVVRHRPAPLTWPILALCLWWPTTNVKLLTGNPVLWAVAAMAAGTLYAWPSVFVLLKPSLLPFALWGIWRRSWWAALAGLGLVSLLFLPMWPDYFAAIANASNPNGLAYSISEVPMLLLPLIAWIGGRMRVAGESDRAEATTTAIPAREPTPTV
jgi:hypothetical protein